MTASSKKSRPVFILASGSPRRKKLLQLFDFPFRVESSKLPEHFNKNDKPGQIVQKLALNKANVVATGKCNAIILGADTVVVHGNNILGKPETEEDAHTMLYQLSKSTHRVFTGVALVKTNKDGSTKKKETFYKSTKVIFGELGETDINQYIASGSPMDKAGAYGIQDDWGALFVKCIEGDYYNIVGLPMHALYKRLKTFAPELW